MWCRSVSSGSTLMGTRQSVSRLSGLSSAQKPPAAEAEAEGADEDRPRLRWRRNVGSAGGTAEEVPLSHSVYAGIYAGIDHKNQLRFTQPCRPPEGMELLM